MENIYDLNGKDKVTPLLRRGESNRRFREK